MAVQGGVGGEVGGGGGIRKGVEVGAENERGETVAAGNAHSLVMPGR